MQGSRSLRRVAVCAIVILSAVSRPADASGNTASASATVAVAKGK